MTASRILLIDDEEDMRRSSAQALGLFGLDVVTFASAEPVLELVGYGFDGVVVTDSLGMEGVRTKYGDDRVPVLALKAGVDQLLNPPDLDVAWNAVLKAVRDGELTEARLDRSILRVLRLKARLGLFTDPYVTHRGVDRTVGTGAHLRAADRIAERTTTLLVNEGGLLPLSPAGTKKLLVVGADPASPSGTTGPPTGVLAGALTELGFTATALSTGTAPSAATIA